MTITYPIFGSTMTPGASEAAQVIAALARKGREHFLQPLSRSAHRNAAMEELATVQEECVHAGWDGHQALPINEDTFRQAYFFIEAFPLELPMPSIAAEPDGYLTMEWHHASRRTLSVSIGAGGDLHYSALFGVANAYGTEVFSGEVPKVIIDLVRRVCAP